LTQEFLALSPSGAMNAAADGGSLRRTGDEKRLPTSRDSERP
jgi:hypothetical protein